MSSDKRLFCSKPFEWFEVTQLNGRGGVYLCCPSWLEIPVGNLKYQSVGEIWNGEKAQEIRRSILDGSFTYCDRSRCSFLQNESGPVGPIEEVSDRDLGEAIEKKLTVLPYGPKQVVCTYDKSCNLSCPTCRSGVIVESADEQEILYLQHKIQDEALKGAEYLHISGSGDPFGSPFFREWLQTMRRQDMPHLSRIHLQTNGLLWTPRMWGTIAEEIQQLVKSAEISIDAATPETYAVNRRGGSFGQLLENLEFIGTLREKGPLEHVKISMVVQENNFREMPDFVRLGKRCGFDLVYFGKLVNWGTFSEEEYASRAIHVPDHPRHSEFVSMLSNGIFDEPTVSLGNLAELREQARGRSMEKGPIGEGYARPDWHVVDYQTYCLDAQVLDRQTRAPLQLRGPAPKRLKAGQYFVCIGGAQTFGRFCEKPYPTLIQERLGIQVLNLGRGGAGPSFFSEENVRLLAYINSARFTVVQVMSGRSASNSLFESVGIGHYTRVADRSPVGCDDAFRELLEKKDPDYAKKIVHETRENWVHHFRHLLSQIEVPTVLLWLSTRSPDYVEKYGDVYALFGEFPQLVNSEMVNRIKGRSDRYIECVTRRGLPHPLVDRFTGAFTTVTDPWGGTWTENWYYPSPEMHMDAANALKGVCEELAHPFRSYVWPGFRSIFRKVSRRVRG